MPRGRPPKPIKDLQRKGTFRADRHAARAAAPPAEGEPEPPFALDEAGRWLWDQLITTLPPRTVASIDAAAMAGMCRWWSLWRQWDEEMLKPRTEQTIDPYKAACMAAAAWKQFEKLASRFGMTPGDRARLRPAGKPADENPFKNFLGAAPVPPCKK